MRDKVLKVLSGVDKGFYHQARTAEGGPRASYGLLTDMIVAEGVGPSEEEIDQRVRRLLGNAGLLTRREQLPENYLAQIERHAFDTWGLEKALAVQGIRVKGAGADRLEKLFTTSASTVLFPAYVESQVIAGILRSPILANIVATETNIDSHVYQSCMMAELEADRQLAVTGEGASLPITTLSLADQSLTLKKYGRLVQATYEALRMQRMNVLSLFLQRIGMQIAMDETTEAIVALIQGNALSPVGADGIASTAMTATTATTAGATQHQDADVSGTLDYDELVKLFGVFAKSGYTMSAAVTCWTNLRTILNMAEFKDPEAGFSFQRTGVLPGPMGANWFDWEGTDATYFKTDVILALDNSIALEQVTEQGVMTESDRLIDKQFERTAISKWTGFQKLDWRAAALLDITA